jgi:hypothetical protein
MMQEINVPAAGYISAITWMDVDDRGETMFAFGSSDGNIQLYERLNDVCTFGLSDVACAHCCVRHFSNSAAVPLPTLVRSSRWHGMPITADWLVLVTAPHKFGT